MPPAPGDAAHEPTAPNPDSGRFCFDKRGKWMARIRSIKPGFFTNDALAELPMAARLLFVGLWCVADREGRMGDRPKKLRAEILPFDDVDVDKLLKSLTEAGFIQRYEGAGERYIQILNFTKHQHPHVKEPPSTIPAPDKPSARTVPARQVGVHVLEQVGVQVGEQRPRERAEALLADSVFIEELRIKFTALDFDFECQKWLDYVTDLPPKGNFKNSLRNWLQKAVVFKERDNGRSQTHQPRNAGTGTKSSIAAQVKRYAASR
jgi:hypothetical protein